MDLPRARINLRRRRDLHAIAEAAGAGTARGIDLLGYLLGTG
jgi:hypothetical protein